MIEAEGAQRRAAARAGTPLVFKYDPELPISARREEIQRALNDRQVLIVAGETGSGKSTQLPQYCLELGRGIGGLIAHTQPRRLAARALAARVADELGQSIGRSVGFRVRFADQVSDATRLVLMTDGLLLAELSSDPLLRRYDTVIVDEAHERTLNVDLLLGVLKKLLPRRPDLKLIVTSATLDVERVAQFFGNAPVITVSGRSYPIEVRYRESAQDEQDPDLPLAVLEAYQEIATEPGEIGNGDILVFLPGEREIRDVGDLLERELQARVEVLSLYSRLSWEQQSKIFQRGTRRRIVLSTNVAETSITVPGIRAVIDSGLARISRYSVRNRLQRLPIEPISRASADQRKGRCGRLAAGLCLRLYSQEDYEQRAAFTEPEVLRTNLAALLLRLAADGLGQAEDFPFIDPPDARALNDGYRLLQELQALDASRGITRRGRAMARLPLDPRLSRSLLESKRFHAEGELLAICAGLSVPDVRIGEDPAAADPFEDGKSEFSALLKLWRAYRTAREGPRRELRRWCKERHLSLLRLSEWDDVYTQVVDRARELGIVAQRAKASYTGVHRSLLAGFCSMVGTRGEDGAYSGPRGIHFHIFPGSPLARRRPRWVMAASIVETSRVFARRVAQIEPTWIENAAAHLLKREYLSPDWDEGREEVVARERVGLLGLILSANRLLNYGPIAPEESRRIFAREALVYRRLTRRPQWLLDNDAALLDAQRIEERLRTRGLLQDPETLVEFYDRALPRQVSSGATLEFFSRHLTEEQRAALTLTDAVIFAHLPDAQALAEFPETTMLRGVPIEVHYRFAPGESDDGATLFVPVSVLPLLHAADVQAAIPGFSVPRIEAMLRSLPKEARRSLIPIPEAARDFIEGAGRQASAQLEEWLQAQRGIPPTLLRFQAGAVPSYMNPHVAVVDGMRELARGEDLKALRVRCAAAARAKVQDIARELYGPTAWRRFELDELPESVRVPVASGYVTLFPTLGLQHDQLRVALEWTEDEAAMSWFDCAVLLAKSLLDSQVRALTKTITASGPLILSASPYMSSSELTNTALFLAIRQACFADEPAPRTRERFLAIVDRARARLQPALDANLAALSALMSDAAEVRRALDDPRVMALREAVEESREHLHGLLTATAIRGAGPQWLRQLARYLKAELRRWRKNAARGSETPHILQQLRLYVRRHRHLQREMHAQLRASKDLRDLGFWIEEFRVSLYAQELKTLGPISAARLEQRAADIEAWLTR